MRRKVLRSKARVTRTPRKDHLGKNGNAGVVEKRDTRLSDCRKTSKNDKDRIVKERSFSTKELAVLTDPQFGGKDLALVNEKFSFLTF